MDQILLEATSEYMKDKKGSENSRLEITKGELCPTNLCSMMRGLAMAGRSAINLK